MKEFKDAMIIGKYFFLFVLIKKMFIEIGKESRKTGAEDYKVLTLKIVYGSLSYNILNIHILKCLYQFLQNLFSIKFKKV